jgi:hypothetical protein
MKEYLGDGAYVDFDGWTLWVTTENGISETNRIAFEPDVYEALVRYVEKHELWRAKAVEE